MTPAPSDERYRDTRFPRDGHGPYRLLRGVHDRLVRRLEHALDEPMAAQVERLAVILRGARGTAFGHDHHLDSVTTLDEFRAAVPVRDHEGHRPWLDRVAAGEPGVLTRERVSMLLETSGTTGRAKHLPVTAAWAGTVSDAQKAWVLGLVRDHEAAARGRALTVVSPAVHGQSPGGLPIGSNTGRMHRAQPWWLRARYPVPYRVFCLEPAELRYYAILRFAVQAPVTSITTANPSTVLLLCRRLLQWQEALSADLADGTLRHGPAADLPASERRLLEWRLRRQRPPTDWSPASLWNLATVNCWKGGPARYFADRLPEALGGPVPVREVGITASEGFFAVPLGADWEGGVLWTPGHLLEFVGDDGQPRWAWELEDGERVRLVVTTEAGLYRYDLGDVVEVVGRCRNTPVVRFTGKAGRFLNGVGERVTEAQVSDALRQAADATGIHPVGFCVHVRLQEVPVYEVGVELDAAASAESLTHAFDEALMERNVEYQGRRGTGRIGEPVAVPMAPGTFARFRAARVVAGASDGQVKDPVIAIDEPEWQRVVGESHP